MDVILTPTKLNGTIHSRPSAVSVCLNEIAVRMARLTGQAASIGPVCDDMDMLSRIEIDPADMEAICGGLDSMINEDKRVDCKGSLAALDLILPIAAATKGSVAFVGEPSLAEKDIDSSLEILRNRGVSFSKGDLKIKRRERGRIAEVITTGGHLGYGHLSLNGKEDPWFLCGLLFALPLLEGNSTIRMTTLPESTELADMAVDVLRQYGIQIDASVNEYGYPHFQIPGSQKYVVPDEIILDGDWSAAAFWLGCGALGGNVTVRGLDPDSIQSSRQILDKLHTMGAGAGIGEAGANVTAASLTGCNINAGHIPNLIPVLSVCLASASGPSTLTDIGGYPTEGLIRILTTLGANITGDATSLRFEGRPIFSGGDGGHDMDPITILAATAASCVCSESVLIRNAGIINKYYPGFFDELEALGGRIRIMP